MKISHFSLATIISLIISSNALSAPKTKLNYTASLSIINNTKKIGFFGVCNKPIHSGGSSLCSIPQKINPGETTIFVPPFKKAYPVFSLTGTEAYTCSTSSQPEDQRYLLIPSQSSKLSLVIDSFILDKQGIIKNISCDLCGLTPGQETKCYGLLSDQQKT